MFEIVRLEDIDIQKFWDHVMEDIPGYFFFILDQKQYPEDSQFLIALEQETIVGICLIWKNSILHVRGKNKEIMKTLVEAIPEDLTITQVSFPNQYKELLHNLYPDTKYKLPLHRMLLKKENMIPRYQLDKPFTQRSLTKEDAVDIARLCSEADPVYWGNAKAENFVFDGNQIYTGLFDGDRLISFIYAWIDEDAAIIANAATHPEYQNQGLATYLVNEGIHKMMEHTEIAIIHVLTDNAPAIKVYTKVGYEVYRTYEMVGIEEVKD
jgi:ribosomal protein S18 acetylase RimI-like enzyme